MSFCSASGRSPAKKPDAARLQPDPAIGDLDVREDVGDGKLLLQALRGFVGIGCERRDVDQGVDPVIRARVRDQGATVRVADKDHRTADPPEATGDAVNVAF
jgi:hypothetical protein